MAYYRRSRYAKRPKYRRSLRKRRPTRRVRKVSRVRRIRPSHPRGSASSMRVRPGRILYGKGTGLTSARKKPIEWSWHRAAQDATRFLSPTGISAEEWAKLSKPVKAIALKVFGYEQLQHLIDASKVGLGNVLDAASSAWQTYQEATADPATFPIS